MKVVVGEGNSEHRAGRKIVHQTSAEGRDCECVFEREDSGETCGHVFTDAMAHHCFGLDAKRHPPTCKGVLDREEGGLGEPGLIQPFGRGVFLLFRWIQRLTQIERERLHELLSAEVESLTKDRLVLIEIAAHIDVLGTLPREHEDDRGRGFRGKTGGKGFALSLCKRTYCLSRVLDDQCAAMGERMPANLAGEGNVCQT